MKKFFQNYKKLIAGFILFCLASFTAGAVSALIAPGSVQYQGVNTPALPEPGLNAYYGVPDLPGGDGNEANFIRVKKTTEGNDAYRNSIDTTCGNGDKFNVWFYVHNGASTSGNNNGTGPSVAKNVNARIDLDNAQESDRFDIKGFLTSSNAGNISDGAVIDCGDKKFRLKFVSGSAFLDMSNTQVSLPASIVAGGTPIGTTGLNGNVWGCWEQRVWMGVIVEVEEIPEEVLTPAVCEALEAVVLGSKQVRVEDVKFTANDATINDVTINFGDGNEKTVKISELPIEHTYATTGDKTITATLNTTFEGQSKAVTGPNCKKVLTVTEEEQPIYACEDFKMVMVGRRATTTFNIVAENGAAFKDATIVYSADGKEVETVLTNQVDNGTVTDVYTFAEGSKNVRSDATVRFNVGNEVKEVKCQAKAVLGVQTPETPEELPNTGAGSIAGLMAAVTVAGTALHRRFTLKRQ